MTKRYYLAYGMNTDKEGMSHRCPTAVPLEAVTLHHHLLVARGIADVIPQRGSRVQVALWEIQPKDEAALDRLEGYPHHYGKKMVTVRRANGERISAMIYVMTGQAGRGQSRFSYGYRETLRRGYRDFGMAQRQIGNADARADAYYERKFDATEQVPA